MKKLNRNSLRGFAAGVLASAMVASVTISTDALSALKQINVSMGGISLFVDGQLKVPMDAKGNPVEPFIYNGTTYLPLRALTDLLTDKSVDWNGKTQSIYIGQKPGAGEVVRMDELKATKGNNFKTGTNAQFTLMDQTITPFNKQVYDGTYILNEGYDTLQGMFVATYSSLGSRLAGALVVSSVDRYGVKTELARYELKAGDDPIPVEVNVRGCYAIEINADANAKIDDFEGSSGCFYDATITTATMG